MKHTPNRTRRPITFAVLDRFLPNVDRSGTCWLWMGKRDQDGYGVFYQGGGDFRAHRVAYEAAFDKAPGDLFVCHRCDNPQCVNVNPSHLFLASSRENTADRHAKGRSASGDRSGARTRPDRVARGSRQGHAKLTEDDVRNIRKALAERVPGPELQRKYGVSQGVISHIKVGRTWRHVT